MDISLKFLGAAGTVTGSKYLLTAGARRILIDCGMFQGLKELRLLNRESLPVDPGTIDTVVITHAHIDHTGYLPCLVRDGFRGRIVCTEPTADLMRIMLRDAARLQEEEAEFAFKKGYSKHSKPEPLFTLEDAERVFPLMSPKPIGKDLSLGKGIELRFITSGHILGAASVKLTVSGDQQSKSIVFSGDIGRYNDPIMPSPSPIGQADVVVMESTYGDRENPADKVESDLEAIIMEAVKHGGPLVMPAFALGRTQTLIYYIQKLIGESRIPALSVFIDSPMAISVTNLYEQHPAHHRIKVTKENGALISLFDAANIHYCNTRESSRALNDLNKPCIIISASGMATGGRILHHMFHRLRDPDTTFLIAGYQAAGTRGRDLIEGRESIKIFGQYVPVKAQVRVINGLSAHADRSELLQWASTISDQPKKVFITHGEPEVAKKFATTLMEKRNWNGIIPEYLETFRLFEGI